VSGVAGGARGAAQRGPRRENLSHDPDIPGHLWRKSGIFSSVLSVLS